MASTPKKRASRQTGSSKYLEEARNQIKSLLDSKLLLSKEISQLNQQLRSAHSGLEQIYILIETDNSFAGTNTSEAVQLVIAKFYQIRNDYESKNMEL